MSAPRILVTCWRRELPTYLGERTLLDTLDPAYTDALARAGALALIAPRPPAPPGPLVERCDPPGSPRDPDAPRSLRELAGELLELADGLLVTGGGDVAPAAYGAPVEDVADVDAAADAWELELIAAARERSLPTLAVCRGAQLLAVAHGGRLAQRLSPSEAHGAHLDAAPAEILARRHRVSLAAASRVREALGADALHVNTIHHHGIADPGELRVTATASDGTIEAVEPRGDWCCVGVQWHPEKMPEDPRQQRLFSQLVANAARARVMAHAAGAGATAHAAGAGATAHGAHARATAVRA
ncbi:MAG TPA: gamma-glutamyl-gamma-aminobutyrate hydrolase family protein [Solirubrobacteraceae bacterium]|nr:gamma-glutamyl-gamma-aminobutyrate hydrolase family protein [Solirubrobacteraceae bacterium]